MLLDGLFTQRICTGEAEIHFPAPMLFPAEELAMAGAIEKRRREFAVGRSCARQAMRKLGLPPAALPVDRDRAPLWPDGVVGCISHSKTRCGAAVALRSHGVRSIGLDIEEADPLEDDFADEICIGRERSWLSSWPARDRGLLLKAFFSAKECTYKCQYPLSRQAFGFDAISIDLQVGHGTFTATFEINAPPFKPGDQFHGRVRLSDHHIVTAMSIA
jgi:4'-phosphopantetheinyl transferase EntD